MTSILGPSPIEHFDRFQAKRRAAAEDRLDLWFRLWLLFQILFVLFASGFVWLALGQGIEAARRELSGEPGAGTMLAIGWLLGLGTAAKSALLAAKNRPVAGRRMLLLGLLPWTVMTAETTAGAALIWFA